MQEKLLFEYAVIRVVPCVEREEFLNAGVVLYCAAQQFLQAKYYLNHEKLTAFNCQVEAADIEKRLYAFAQIAVGGTGGGSIAALPKPSRFRWLTAVRSTIVQTSPVHPGFCKDAGEMLDQLYEQLVK